MLGFKLKYVKYWKKRKTNNIIVEYNKSKKLIIKTTITLDNKIRAALLENAKLRHKYGMLVQEEQVTLSLAVH